MAMAMATTTSSAATASALSHSSLHLHTPVLPSHSSLFLHFHPHSLTITSKLPVYSFNVYSNAKRTQKSIGYELGYSSALAPASTHVTVCLSAATGDNNKTEVATNEGEGEGEKKGEGKGVEKGVEKGDEAIKGVKALNLISESDMLKKKAKKVRLRRKRLLQKRRLRKKGSWPPSKMAKLKKV